VLDSRGNDTTITARLTFAHEFLPAITEVHPTQAKGAHSNGGGRREQTVPPKYALGRWGHWKYVVHFVGVYEDGTGSVLLGWLEVQLERR